MKKSLTTYLVISFIGAILIGVAIGYTLGRTTSGGSAPSDQTSASLANDLPASTDEPVTKEGTFGCLKPNTDGRETMECAMGLTTPDGTQYGLGSSDPAALAGITTGTSIRVTGTLGAPASPRYTTAGTIQVQTVTKL